MDSSSPTKETEQCTEYRDLRFLTLLNEALRIPFRNIHFTGFILITSLPLLLFMMFFQTLLESSVQDFLNLERPLMRPSDRIILRYHRYSRLPSRSSHGDPEIPRNESSVELEYGGIGPRRYSWD
ncbi:hypothetical protein vseg_015103 [Gypsophila vaccaria]